MILQKFLWHVFFYSFKNLNMQTNKDLNRNRPAEDGRKNDPDLRDESAAQPGVQTMSSSNTDEANQDLTETARDSFRENNRDKNADPDLYGVDYKEDDDIEAD
jgi:cell division protein FtsX